MSELYEKVKNMTPEEVREFRKQQIQDYHRKVEHIEDPDIVSLLDKAAEIILKNRQEQ